MSRHTGRNVNIVDIEGSSAMALPLKIHEITTAPAGHADRTVLLVHGFPGGSADWSAIADLLSTNARVLVPDLLGFGESERPERFEDLWVDHQAYELAQSLDALGVTNVLAVGHDLGGPVVAMLGARRPDLVGAALFAACNLRGDLPIPGVFKLLPVPVLGRMVAGTFMSGPGIRYIARHGTRLGHQRPQRNDPSEVRAIRTIFATALTDYPRWFGSVQAAADAMMIPMSVVWGEHDPFFDVEHARAIAKGLHDAPLRLYPGGHFPQLEAPEVLAEEIEALSARRSAQNQRPAADSYLRTDSGTKITRMATIQIKE